MPEQIAYLVGALRASERYPVPIVPQFEGLNFWYLPSEGGSPAELLFFAHQTMPGIEGGAAGEFVALSQPLPVEAILERQLMPVGDEARAALGTWMELHLGIITPASMDANLGKGDYPFLSGLGLDNAHPVADQAADELFLRHMERMEQARQLLTAVLPYLGIHTKVIIEPHDSTAMVIGNIRVSPSDQGWRVAIDASFPEVMDLTAPDSATSDWNDVFDAAIAARGSSWPSAYLAVINCASGIGTQAALDFIGNYSDDTSPAHEMATIELARALGREEEWHAATIGDQKRPPR